MDNNLIHAAENLAAHIKGSFLETRDWLVNVGTTHDWTRDEDVILVTIVKSKAPADVWKLAEREQDGYKINIDFETEAEEEEQVIDDSDIPDFNPEQFQTDKAEEEFDTETAEIIAQSASSEIVADAEDQYVLGHVKAIYDFFDALGARIEKPPDPNKKDDEDDDEGLPATLPNGLTDLLQDEAFKAERHPAAEVLAKFSPNRRELLLEKIEPRIDTLKLSLNGTIDIRYCVDQLRQVAKFLGDPEIESKTVGAVAVLELYNS